jgi:hypothetical protein
LANSKQKVTYKIRSQNIDGRKLIVADHNNKQHYRLDLPKDKFG